MSDLERFLDMPNSVYHVTSAMSKTTIDLAHNDPYSVAWSKACPTDTEKLKTFDFGDAMHAICLEPERLKSEFIELPAYNLRTNKDKEAKAAFLLEHKDKKALTDIEFKQLRLMFESVMAHGEARALIEAQGAAEESFFWTDEKTGLRCKCRPDKHIEKDGRLLIDVKTTPSLKKFNYSVDDYRYYVQDPWYCDGVARFYHGETTRMEFLVIQKDIECGRYPVAVVKLPLDVVEYGRQVYRDDLHKHAEYLQLGSPPETRELDMGFRFNQRMDDHFGEVC